MRTGDGGGLLLGLSLPLARLKRLRRQLAAQIADLKSDRNTMVRAGFDLGFVNSYMAGIFTCLSDFSWRAAMSCFISALVAFTDATSDTSAP